MWRLRGILVLLVLLMFCLLCARKVLIDNEMCGKGTIGGTRLDLNSATAAQFSLIKGIGRVRAEKILEIRRKAGPFKNLEDFARADSEAEKMVSLLRGKVVFE